MRRGREGSPPPHTDLSKKIGYATHSQLEGIQLFLHCEENVQKRQQATLQDLLKRIARVQPIEGGLQFLAVKLFLIN